MRKYIILDKNGDITSMPRELAILKILNVLKNGIYERGMFHLSNEVYCYVEDKGVDVTTCILQDVTLLYQAQQKNGPLLCDIHELQEKTKRKFNTTI